LQHCSKCHGHYGDEGDYPNLLIPESLAGTDSLLYKSNYQSPQFIGWFNQSWFAQGDHPARLEPFNGYIAPPLDGIWITAPYLHNGSVPTLEGVLNSRARPAYWSRDFDHPQYDFAQVGWKYTRHEGPGKNEGPDSGARGAAKGARPGDGVRGVVAGSRAGDRVRGAAAGDGATAVYNTTIPGYGNYGHTYGDRLSERERKAIIEYLKTL
jgi:mono/diheme cytochrome c family protein